ncbi:MAG: glucose-6-phosphate isomerase, partial [Bacteroidota bacterium]
MSKLTQLPAWKSLENHFKSVEPLHMRDLFKNDPERFKKFSVRFNDIFLDFSKNRITDETLELLLKLADEAGVKSAIQQMFSGERINTTEGRAVLHTALRNFSGEPVIV